jgi:uncharacterized protein YegJ (DUF2314 family)
MFILVLLILLFASAFTACSQRRDNVVERPGEPSVYTVPEDDSDMESAISEARRTVIDFTPRLTNPLMGQSYASVKAPLREGDIVEHVWIREPQSDGRRFHGLLGNTPVNITEWQAGDSISVARDSISDWMVVVNDTVYGGYTVHVLRARMTPAEKSTFDSELGLYFPPTPISLPPSIGPRK